MRIPSLSISCAALLTIGLAAQKPTGPTTPPHIFVESGVDSGYIHNLGSMPRVVFTKRIQYAGTEWMNLQFGEHTNLPDGSYLRLTGVRDNVRQRLDGRSLVEWGLWSASFNGGEMILELVAGPSTRANRVTVPVAVRGLPAYVEPETICGSTDDRVKSNDKRQGRLWLGCTGWLAGIVANNTLDLMLTAGHCTSSGPRILEFNVPDSQPNGTVVRAAPNDQYPYTILARLSGGVGSDWQVATVSANSNTNQRPTQTNGGVFYQLGAVPSSPSGQNITITGYGTTSPRNRLSQVQKIHTGPLSQVRATSLCYSTDTTGGNSGSPVIHANTGRAIGIHTHGGCTQSGGCNQGTRIDRSDLQAAINAAGKTPGAFRVFGTGCRGTGQGPSFCASNNATGGTLSNSTAPNEYAYIATTSTALRVTGFEIYTSTNNNSSATVPTAIYADNNGTPGAQLATGPMTVGGTPGFYRTTFGSPVNIPAGTFYVSVNHANSPVYLANLSSGTAGGAFWRRTGTTFARSGIITNSSFRVLCSGGGGNNAIPAIGNSGLPEINQTYRVTGAQGRANAPALLVTGGSNTRWSGGTLPFSLAGLGARAATAREPRPDDADDAEQQRRRQRADPGAQLVDADRPKGLPPVDRDRRPGQQPRPRAERWRRSDDRRLIADASGVGRQPVPEGVRRDRIGTATNRRRAPMNDFLGRIALWLALSVLLCTQSTVAQLRQEPSNPKFEDGQPGDSPPGWRFVSRSGGTIAIDAESVHEGKHSACVDASEASGERKFANLMQTLDATPMRGQRVRYRAAVMTAGLTRGSTAQLWFRVDGPKPEDGPSRSLAFDNMGDRPIRSEEWAHYEIVLDVADNAERLVLGMFVIGTGKAWIDDVSLEAVDAKTEVTGADRSARSRPRMNPRVQKALAEAQDAPQQPFWTSWLALPGLAMLLFALGLWPTRPRPDDEDRPVRSGFLRAFALRFTVAYWLIYCLPGPFPRLLAKIPDVGPQWSAKLGEWHRSLDQTLATWAAHNVFGIEGELVPPNGSGDTTQGYLTVLIGFVLALLLGLVWTLISRRHPSRDTTVDLLRSYLRYVLAFAMLGYGLAKVSVTFNQFPVVSEYRLGRTWGETSPMGVVWGFMGASRPYTIFAGLSEVLGALLLIWRHTALLGALVTAGVMTNVMMLNYCYDVPVKLYSTHLLVMALLIMVPDVRRLTSLLLWNRNPTHQGTPSIWRGSVMRWVRWIPKLLVLAIAVAHPLWNRATDLYEHYSAPAQQAPAQNDDQSDGHRLTSRGYRWINEVPFNR